MWEYEVKYKTGETDFLFGYSLKNACERQGIKESDIEKVIYSNYID